MNESKIQNEDFTRLSEVYDFEELKNSSILITGATGLVGSQLIKYLDFLNICKNYNIKLYALVRSEQKAKKVFKEIAENNRIIFCYGDILSLPEIPDPIDYIIHGASITSSRDFVEKPVETIDIAINGTLNILKFAKSKNVKSFIYLSSMEAFGITNGEGEVKEEDLGYIDVMSPRSSYSEGKRMCECLCSSFASEYKVPAKSIRLAQTLGPGIDYNDTRVTAYFARSVIENTDITLKTNGATKRPIIYTRDAISAILTVLLKGETANVYTAANPKTFMTIKETAELIVSKIAKDNIKLNFDIDVIHSEYAPNVNLNLNIDKLSSLGWTPEVDLLEAYEKMIDSMRKN